MKPTLFFIFLYFCVGTALPQRVINVANPATGVIDLAPGISIPKIKSGYTAWLPESDQIRGAVVFTHPRRDTTASEALIDYALENQLAVMYATTDNRLEFLFDTARMRELEGYVHAVIDSFNIPAENLLFCGMSLEGTRALKLAAFAKTSASGYHLVPKAIAICDAPLDMVRFYKEMDKAKQLNFNPIAANEGDWITAYLASNLGGPPSKALNAYISYSPYCAIADGGLMTDMYLDIAIRAYTEPDILWWMRERGKDYYGMNALDLAGLINNLTLRGNQSAELIITRDRGYRHDGSRHPHSWSIVDEVALIDWFSDLLE